MLSNLQQECFKSIFRIGNKSKCFDLRLPPPTQLVANAVLFVCVNCVGIFHRWMTEHDLRTSNQKREEYSAIRSQKEIKKYQQVKLRRFSVL